MSVGPHLVEDHDEVSLEVGACAVGAQAESASAPRTTTRQPTNHFGIERQIVGDEYGTITSGTRRDGSGSSARVEPIYGGSRRMCDCCASIVAGVRFSTLLPNMLAPESFRNRRSTLRRQAWFGGTPSANLPVRRRTLSRSARRRESSHPGWSSRRCLPGCSSAYRPRNMSRHLIVALDARISR